MPNYYNNYITIKFNSNNDLHNFEMDFLNSYECFEKEILRKGTRGIVVKTITCLKVDFEWIEKIFDTYEKCWIRIDWNEEGGIAGVWVGHYEDCGIKVINKMKWNDLSFQEMALLF